MPLPTIEELDDAYDAGRTAETHARNPHFFGTGLWMQWNYGQRDGMKFAVATHEARIKKIARIVAYVMYGISALVVVRFALL